MSLYRDLNDFGWRPTFVPRMRESQTSRQDFCASPWNSLYLSYAELIGELEQPKRALAVLRDEIRMQAYKRAIEKYVRGALGIAHDSWWSFDFLNLWEGAQHND